MMELSLPTAVFSAFIGSSVLLMALIYVSTTPGAPKGLSWWIAGMAMCCIRYATVYWFLATRLPAAIFLAESLQVMSAIALAAGGVEFLGRRVSKIHFAAISAVAVAWAAYTTLVYPNFLLRTIPLYFTSGILLILVGVAFLRAQPTGQRSGYALTGILFMAWGLHKLDFPFLRPIQWFAPYGFLIAMILCMDASRNARTDFTVTARQIAVLYPACRCGALCPLALMESADPRLISLVDFSPN